MCVAFSNEKITIEWQLSHTLYCKNINVFFYSLSKSFAYLFEQKPISLEMATLTTNKQAVAAIVQTKFLLTITG